MFDYKMAIDITPKPRLVWIDTAKAICILLVVLQHTSNYTHINYPYMYDFQTFRMPLYFILSGLFFKQYEGFVGFVKRKTNKLIIPYVFFFSVGGVFLPITLFHFFDIRIWSYKDYGIEAFLKIFSEQCICNPSIWFLVCLFEINILFYIIFELAEHFNKLLDKNYIILLISLCFGLVGIIMSLLHINLPYFVDSSFSAIPFFCFGWFLRNQTEYLYWKNTPKGIYISIFLIISSMIFIHFTNLGGASFLGNSLGGVIQCAQLYPYGIIGTLCVLTFARILGNIPLISYIGRYSIIVLCTHAYLIQFSAFITSHFIEKNLYVIFVVAVIIQVLIIPFFIKYLGYFTAQKDLIKIK